MSKKKENIVIEDDFDSKSNFIPTNTLIKDNDLFVEENNKVENIIRIKKIGNESKGEKWKVFNNNKLIFTIDGDKLLKKERYFLYTAEGCSYLLSEFKKNTPSIFSLKKGIKKILESKKSIASS